jgi:hypothetical protein
MAITTTQDSSFEADTTSLTTTNLTPNAFKRGLDLITYQVLNNSPSAFSVGTALASDLRNNQDAHPLTYSLASATLLNLYNPITNDWAGKVNPSLAGTFGAGAASVFAPSHGFRGTTASGATTTTVTPSATVGTTVGVNQLANRGDGIGYKVRIIDNGSGGTGKTEERYIVGNTSSTTPLITLDAPLSFTPVVGSAIELLSGRVYMLGAGTVAAGIFKWFDPALNLLSGNLATTNLPATIATDSSMVALDPLHTPYSQKPGEGFILGEYLYNSTKPDQQMEALRATATTATTLTGQASGGDSIVLANEYRNFQIRIVEDRVNPTATGQRRKIASHTAGVSPVYTVPTWTVTPSANAKYVVENANEILLFTSAVATTYTYAAYAIAGGQAADTWSTTTYGARGNAVGAGVMSFQPFGMKLDIAKNARYSQIFSFRGANSTSLDVLDIAGGANGTWTNTAPYEGFPAFNTGACCTYSPVSAPIEPLSGGLDRQGTCAYIFNAGTTMLTFDARTRTLQPFTRITIASSTAVVGQKIASTVITDRRTGLRIPRLLCAMHSLSTFAGVTVPI